MADYLAISTAVTDRIYASDGSFKGEYLGGAGIYAFSGMRLWSASVNLVTGVGADFKKTHKDWIAGAFREEPFLMVKDAHTAVSLVRYHSDGEREETPLYGLDHYQRLEATPKEIAEAVAVSNPKGIYIFKGTGLGYWNSVFALKKLYGFAVCWEINASYAVPEREREVRETAQQCDMFSINRTEGMDLFQVRQEKDVINDLQAWKIPLVYYRVGKKGGYLITPDDVVFSPSCTNVQVVDPTGAGNASTAGLFLNWCEKLPLGECGERASDSAADCIKQFGPPMFSGDEL